MLAGEQIRRAGQSLLPVRRRRRRLSHTVSCWYCDFKITAFNEALFAWGRKHARFLRVWFSIGVGFSLMALFAGICGNSKPVGFHIFSWNCINYDTEVFPANLTTDITIATKFTIDITTAISICYFAPQILIGELVVAFHVGRTSSIFWNLSSGVVFGLSPLGPAFSLSIVDAGFMIFSTLISVFIHEFGHAVAAASEGVQIEYIAMFLAVLVPGALVALSHELLNSIPRYSQLRVYCAGIWHNAVCCIVCGLALLFLPVILSPLYVYAENPVVLSVKPESPLSGYLTTGDVMLTVNDFVIHSPQEWMERMVQLDSQTLDISDSWKISLSFSDEVRGKGYCVPSSWIDGGVVHPSDGSYTCPDGLAAFNNTTCLNSNMLDSTNNNVRTECVACLPAKDVATLQKCGRGLDASKSNKTSSLCLQDESCLVPIQLPGLTWVEITYTSADCLHSLRNSSAGTAAIAIGSNICKGTFVFIGDVLSEFQSVHLTCYWPRWGPKFASLYPNMVEKMLAYIFRVSLTLALLNSMPVFFLDGESIVEVALFYLTWLSPMRRRQSLRTCLFLGSVICCLALLHTSIQYLPVLNFPQTAYSSG